MGKRMVGEAEATGREGLAWLLGVASLRRESRAAELAVRAWVAAVEVQRGEARDEAAAAEARCDELELQVTRLRSDTKMSADMMDEVRRAAEKLVQREQAAQAEVAALRVEVERLRSGVADERAACIREARGCFDLLGGYSGGGDDERLLSAFHHGVRTVVRTLGGEA
jgi:hypothetical protein